MATNRDERKYLTTLQGQQAEAIREALKRGSGLSFSDADGDALYVYEEE